MATSALGQVAASVAAVQWDHEKPKNRLREQEEQLREYVAHHLYPYSPFYRRRFDTARIAPRNVTGFDDLAKLEPTRWSDVAAEPVAFLLRPTERAIIRFGERKLVSAITRAKFRGKVSQVNRDLIDPAYKPIHWHFDGDVPVGYSAEDVERLSEAGRRILHSGKARARQTAEIWGGLAGAGVAEADALAPNDDPAVWAVRLDGETRDVMLVGHLPHLERLTGLLVTGDADQPVAGFPAGGLVILERTDTGWAVADARR